MFTALLLRHVHGDAEKVGGGMLNTGALLHTFDSQPGFLQGVFRQLMGTQAAVQALTKFIVTLHQ